MCYQRIRADNGLRPNQRTIQNRRSHPDEAFVLNGAGVDDGGVTDGDVASEDARKIIGEMQDGVVLNVGVFADDDAVDVAAEDGVIPNTGMRAEGDITEDDGGAGDVDVRAEGGALAEESV